MNEKLTDGEIEKIAEIASSKLFARETPPVTFTLDMPNTVGLIGQLQLAFRHPENNGPTREMIEGLVRRLIGEIDPSHGDVYQFLMLGFNPAFDEPQENAGKIVCRHCSTQFALVRAIVKGTCPGCMEPICPACGCTSSAGCAEGCFWLPSGICSACAGSLEN